MHSEILLSGSPQAQEMLQTQLQSIHKETAAAFKACLQSLPGDKREPFQRLADELEHYWSNVGRTFAPGVKGKTELGNSTLRADVLSQHAEILKIAKAVSAVNDAELKEAQVRTAEVS